ncbi:3D domain-containing protein [Filibacter tadaridae]|uniref:Cell wall-binding protein YocH n=1 Tax=Filibacter tadaridae TaxID=2483811 RepID=A0A3P5X5N7_9BACL|nr:3D domain-containing protein [Filibacter tadaridae]VDC29519.1 Cell wall-binding protein YocH precursor [Filibacter tadaridae]
MKRLFVGLVVMGALSLGSLIGQASASTNHIVKPGDTLWNIALANDVSVENLLAWNALDSTLIQPSQEIKIEKGSNVHKYTVVAGDTLFEIAESHNIKLNDLMRLNNISDHLILPGQQLILDGDDISMDYTNLHPTSRTKTIEARTPMQTRKVAIASEQTPPPVEVQKEVSKPAVVPAASTGTEMLVTATAYTAYCEGCSGVTYTGIDLRSNPDQKVIAVDPSIIPLGSRVWVEGYGEAIAGDIGGAIKGHIIDVFIENKQDALKWGRKKIKIKVLN